MKCKIIRFLYKIVLFNFKRSFFINHFYKGCLENYDMNKNEEDKIKMFFKESIPSDNIDIWKNIRYRILQKKVEKRRIPRTKLIFGFATALSIVIAVSFIFLQYSPIQSFKKREIYKKLNESDKKVLITSLEIDGREAKGIYFFSREKGRVIVWVQKN